MAKDGTRRGGARVGAGRKPKSLTDKINSGDTAQVLLEPVGLFPEDENPDISFLPPMSDFMTEEQKVPYPLQTEAIYAEVYNWLKSRGCEKLVSQIMIEEYVLNVARWRQCEQAISASGFISKHPTTGGAIASPYVQMAHAYAKNFHTIWYEIYQIVKENCSGEYQGGRDPMEQLLNL